MWGLSSCHSHGSSSAGVCCKSGCRAGCMYTGSACGLIVNMGELHGPNHAAPAQCFQLKVSVSVACVCRSAGPVGAACPQSEAFHHRVVALIKLSATQPWISPPIPAGVLTEGGGQRLYAICLVTSRSSACSTHRSGVACGYGSKLLSVQAATDGSKSPSNAGPCACCMQ